ncbi:MAG: hypothetical protein Kow0068_17650 [Marinilabiliales bacterium]
MLKVFDLYFSANLKTTNKQIADNMLKIKYIIIKKAGLSPAYNFKFFDFYIFSFFSISSI